MYFQSCTFLFLSGIVLYLGSAEQVSHQPMYQTFYELHALTGGDVLRFLMKNRALDIFESSDILRVLDEVSEGRFLRLFDSFKGNDIMKVLVSIRGNSLVKASNSKRSFDSLSGSSLGYSKEKLEMWLLKDIDASCRYSAFLKLRMNLTELIELLFCSRIQAVKLQQLSRVNW
ncbi:uncharacterized protein LOC143228492 [Tachypleus tridentatus]|uniref:uncharacterized protein LOC143228492 n=1 Tax=Tachypleus tridentatus TaxID=6853 RepID=UPI003FD4190D